MSGRGQQLRLNDAERAQYADAGFLLRESAFAPQEVATLCRAVERTVRAAEHAVEGRNGYSIEGNRYVAAGATTVQFEHAPQTRTLRVIQPFHHFDPAFEALIDDPRLVEPMRDLVGSERVSLFTDKLNLKRPGEGSAFRWHQDSPYWAAECDHVDQLPNVMLALDAASEANGCLRVIPGSHRQGFLPGTPGDRALDPLFTDPRCFDEAEQHAVEMAAGSLFFFGPHLVHGSQPNDSPLPRRALILTYQPAGHAMFRLDAKREAGRAESRP